MNSISYIRCAGLLALIGSLTTAGCTLETQDAPSLTGPSEFALSVNFSASPDQIRRDGVSQSLVTVTQRGPNGEPIQGTLTIFSNGLGTVSADVITTGPDGRATFAVIAPPLNVAGDEILIQLLPVGTNYANASTRNYTIGVYPSNPTPPTAAILGPTDALVGETVVFDASGSTDGGVSCQLAGCTYEWDFGDGTGGSGMVVRKAYTVSGRYVVQLTVADAFGATSIRTHVISVTDLAPAEINVSPNPPIINQSASFAVTFSVPPGVQIARYEWNFGDGTSETTTSPTASHTYTNGAGRTVTVTIVGAGGTTLSVGIVSFTPVPPS